MTFPGDEDQGSVAELVARPIYSCLQDYRQKKKEKRWRGKQHRFKIEGIAVRVLGVPASLWMED